MDQMTPSTFSPYRFFTADDWSLFRADQPLTLSAEEVRRLRGLGDPVDLDEVARIYLSISRLLSAHVEASQLLFRQRQAFLARPDSAKTPFIIGIAGSVAVGKSTTARILAELMARWPSSPKVDLVTTDGFLYPNAVLEAEGLMTRKGFPESYDVGRILRFLSDLKAGVRHVEAPLYSHFSYDVLANRTVDVDQPDILIFEGLNVLQVRDLPKDGKVVPFVSDFFDYSIYIDAEVADIKRWYIDRFMRLRETAFRHADSFFHRYSKIDDADALATAERLWTGINEKNLYENILPTRPRADLVLTKGADHRIRQVALRKL
ncbi:type I pantothenate kinase [Aureimonas sp. Leaf454]|uniref:type I pantothenate kinase n=1 Tax=Aureimonas sp. Leaf454 TaxID=1736381 RepID=UPI0006F9F344|nr:type I pantothenate kinase [Aureimonas sp. Leaf454]KQT42934.1 type I pantothenate kinase [Aureimonas sp. Leaf454]